MHICLKCKKVIKDINEIENGCSCGSKIFIYKKDLNQETNETFFLDFPFSDKSDEQYIPQSPNNLNQNSKTQQSNSNSQSGFLEKDEEKELLEHHTIWLAKGGIINTFNLFGEEDIENIRQIKKGVFEVNLLSLNKGPIIIKDQDEVYYIRLPFEFYFQSKHQK
ncbi:MAG: Zn-ribbon containing protein [Candidatus Anstonellaceae archaeon]